jgi:hypothetical protein
LSDDAVSSSGYAVANGRMSSEPETRREERIVVKFQIVLLCFYADIFLEGLRKPMKHINEDSWSHGFVIWSNKLLMYIKKEIQHRMNTVNVVLITKYY